MAAADQRGRSLRAFDGFAGEFSRHCVLRFDAGAGLAARDLDRLTLLAERLTRDILAWRDAISHLEGSSAGAPPSLHRVGRLLVESIFDDVLIPEATRVLAAAIELAWPAS